MNGPQLFNSKRYQDLNLAREKSVRELLAQLKPALNLQTAVDVGCGAGYFCSVLHSLGLQVTGVDGRESNVQEARRRFPEISFHTVNAEDPTLREMGLFDLVLCFGLLYHLENPFLTIRHLRALTLKLLLVEGICFPSSDPILGLVDEFVQDDQGLNYVALYPSESCLVKMLYRASFRFVYGLAEMPNDSDYHATIFSKATRTLLVASNTPLMTDLVRVIPEPATDDMRPWVRSWTVQLPRPLRRACFGTKRFATSAFQEFKNRSFPVRRKLGLRREGWRRLRQRLFGAGIDHSAAVPPASEQPGPKGNPLA